MVFGGKNVTFVFDNLNPRNLRSPASHIIGFAPGGMWCLEQLSMRSHPVFFIFAISILKWVIHFTNFLLFIQAVLLLLLRHSILFKMLNSLMFLVHGKPLS